jgi:hypothetical protein
MLLKTKKVMLNLDGLDEGEEEDPDADAPPQELDESGRAEQAQEADVDQLEGGNKTTQVRPASSFKLAKFSFALQLASF